MSTCPSAPVFQNFILNAGVTATEMQSSIATFCAVLQMKSLPNAPFIMVTNIASGSSPVRAMTMSAQKRLSLIHI